MASVLIVDSELHVAAAIARDLSLSLTMRASAYGPRIEVAAEANFSKARAHLKGKPPALVVTALQLREYNGIHLAWLASSAGATTKIIVHTDTADPLHAREVRAAGAFYEIRSRLPFVLPAYVSAALPPHDRRDSIEFDRRRFARGGRRAADQHTSM